MLLSFSCSYITGKMALADKLEKARRSGNKELVDAAEKETESVLDMRKSTPSGGGTIKRRGRAA